MGFMPIPRGMLVSHRSRPSPCSRTGKNQGLAQIPWTNVAGKFLYAKLMVSTSHHIVSSDNAFVVAVAVTLSLPLNFKKHLLYAQLSNKCDEVFEDLWMP